MSRRLRRIMSYVSGTPWAIHPAAAERMLAVLERRIAGKRLEQAQIDEATMADREAYAERRAAATKRTGRGGIAVVPVYGTLLARDWEFTQMSHGGATSTESLGRRLRQLDADPDVGTIVLDVDSPGGSVGGMTELAAIIRGLQTLTVAQANVMAASAAYWLASQADEFVVSPSAEIGSIGVYTIHVDARERMAQDGFTPTIVRAGDHKIAANPYEELSPEALSDLQTAVNEHHGMFLADVARGRGIARGQVRERFGDGRMFRAAEAVQRGMADRVATLDETLSRFASGGRVKRRRADVMTTVGTAAEIIRAEGCAAAEDLVADALEQEPEPVATTARQRADLRRRRTRLI